MEDAEPLTTNIVGALPSDRHRLQDQLAGSSSRERVECNELPRHKLCGGRVITSAGGSFLSNNCEDHLNREHGEFNSEEEDEGLYLAINSMPVKVELDEEIPFVAVKHEVENYSYVQDSLTGVSLLREEGVASASWYNAHYMVEDMELEEQVEPPLPKRKRGRPKNYLREEERRERERLARRRLMAKERAKKYRSSLTEEQLHILREKDRDRIKRRRMMMSEDECLLVRIKNRENAQMRRVDTKETIETDKFEGLDSDEEKALLIRVKNRERMRLKRSNMTEEEKVVERKKNRDRVRKRRQIQKAEALLKKLMNVHNDMVKPSSAGETKQHFLQSLMTNNMGDSGPKISEHQN